MSTIQIASGFSSLNRALMYLSALLAPAQAASSIGHTGLTHLGFLAYNWYTAIIWFRAASRNDLGPVWLATVHASTTFALVYIGGIFSKYGVISGLLGMSAIALLWMNNTAAWISWNTGRGAGFEEWEFFFFGWRRLSEGWHLFLLVWQIFNSLEALAMSIVYIVLSLGYSESSDQHSEGKTVKPVKWWYTLAAIPVGGSAMVLIVCPYTVWMELIVQRNKVQSDTDWVAVSLFVAQVVFMLMPKFQKCLPRKEKDGQEKGDSQEKENDQDKESVYSKDIAP
jgi:hypothetical protein